MKPMQHFLNEEHHFTYENLFIRELQEQDTDYLASLFVPALSDQHAGMLESRLMAKRTAGEFMALLIFDEADAFAGVVELYDFKDEQCEIGYRIVNDMQGRGICTKAVACVLAYLKTYGITKATARVKEDNTASLKVLQRNGFYRTSENKGCITMEVRS